MVFTYFQAAIDPKKEPKFQLYELSLSNLHVVFDSRQGAAGDDADSGSEEEEEEGEDGNDDGLDDDAEDALQNKNTYANSRSSSKHALTSVEEGSDGFATDNPLHKNPVADAYMKKNRPASVRGVKFADDSGRGVSIEMSPHNSNASSSTSTPSTSPVPNSKVSEYASAQHVSESGSKSGATTNRVSFGAPPTSGEKAAGATTSRVSFGVDTKSEPATAPDTTVSTTSPSTASPLLTSSPAPSPSPSPSSSPRASAGPAGGRGMPGAGRGGMLSRAKSANAASLNSFNPRLSTSNDKPFEGTETGATADTTVATSTTTTGTTSSSEDSFPRTNLHQSLLANNSRSSSPTPDGTYFCLVV